MLCSILKTIHILLWKCRWSLQNHWLLRHLIKQWLGLWTKLTTQECQPTIVAFFPIISIGDFLSLMLTLQCISVTLLQNDFSRFANFVSVINCNTWMASRVVFTLFFDIFFKWRVHYQRQTLTTSDMDAENSTYVVRNIAERLCKPFLLSVRSIHSLATKDNRTWTPACKI